MSTLDEIRKKVRAITGRPSENQLSTSDLDYYINTFYQYDMPEHLRLLNLRQTYTFETEPNVDLYNFTANTNITIEGPFYADGYPGEIFLNKEAYFNNFPKYVNTRTLVLGNGGSGPYSGNIGQFPVKRKERVILSTVDSNGNSLTAQDDGLGSFTGDVVTGSTINYLTGAIANVTWNGLILSGEKILVNYIWYAPARPFAILFYADQFQLTPVPDRAYKIELDTYVTPTALVNSMDTPQLKEWWQLLAYGAAQKIFADNLDMDSYQKIMILFDEQKRLVLRRTLKQLSILRAPTIYSTGYIGRAPYQTGNNL